VRCSVDDFGSELATEMQGYATRPGVLPDKIPCLLRAALRRLRRGTHRIRHATRDIISPDALVLLRRSKSIRVLMEPDFTLSDYRYWDWPSY
jgi:hypothetical protein